MAFTQAKAAKIRDKLMDKSFPEWIQDITVQAGPSSTYDPVLMDNLVSYSVSIATRGFFPSFDQSQLVGELSNSDTVIIVDSANISSEVEPNSNIKVGAKNYTVIKSEPIVKTGLITQKLYCKGVNNA